MGIESTACGRARDPEVMGAGSESPFQVMSSLSTEFTYVCCPLASLEIVDYGCTGLQCRSKDGAIVVAAHDATSVDMGEKG